MQTSERIMITIAQTACSNTLSEHTSPDPSLGAEEVGRGAAHEQRTSTSPRGPPDQHPGPTLLIAGEKI